MNWLRRLGAAARLYLCVGAVLAVALSGSACDNRQATTGTNGPRASAGTGLPRITVRRTGGIAGVDDELVVESTGAWTATTRAGSRRSGRLSTDQVAQVRAVATDPAIAAEAGRSPAPTRCSDAFTYAVSVDTAQVSYVDCPADAGLPPATVALVQLLQHVTGGG